MPQRRSEPREREKQMPTIIYCILRDEVHLQGWNEEYIVGLWLWQKHVQVCMERNRGAGIEKHSAMVPLRHETSSLERAEHEYSGVF